MISEKWSIGLDIDSLKDHLRSNVLSKEITQQSTAFGGWSVLSGNGDHRDGWQQGHLFYESNLSEEKKELLRSSIAKPFSQYKLETEICTGYLLEVMNLIRSYPLDPHRARIIRLSAGMSSSWHRDGSDDKYSVRLHVPIITNTGCFFETRTEREHLEADGSAYFIHVNREHRVINHGDQDRYHLVMDIEDRGVSQHHRLPTF